MDRMQAAYVQLREARDAVEAARKNGGLFSPYGWLLVGELQGAVEALLAAFEAEGDVPVDQPVDQPGVIECGQGLMAMGCEEFLVAVLLLPDGAALTHSHVDAATTAGFLYFAAETNAAREG